MSTKTNRGNYSISGNASFNTSDGPPRIPQRKLRNLFSSLQWSATTSSVIHSRPEDSNLKMAAAHDDNQNLIESKRYLVQRKTRNQSPPSWKKL